MPQIINTNVDNGKNLSPAIKILQSMADDKKGCLLTYQPKQFATGGNWKREFIWMGVYLNLIVIIPVFECPRMMTVVMMMTSRSYFYQTQVWPLPWVVFHSLIHYIVETWLMWPWHYTILVLHSNTALLTLFVYPVFISGVEWAWGSQFLDLLCVWQKYC